MENKILIFAKRYVLEIIVVIAILIILGFLVRAAITAVIDHDRFQRKWMGAIVQVHGKEYYVVSVWARRGNGWFSLRAVSDPSDYIYEYPEERAKLISR